MANHAHSQPPEQERENDWQASLATLESQFWLRDQVSAFADAARPYGISGHECVESGDDALSPVFGDKRDLLARKIGGNRDIRSFDIRIWDGQVFMLLMATDGRQWSGGDRAILNLLACRHVQQGLLMRECGENDASATLTPREITCLKQRLTGRSMLDIGSDLACSALAIEMYLLRAARKLGVASEAQAAARAAAMGLLSEPDRVMPPVLSNEMRQAKTQSRPIG